MAILGLDGAAPLEGFKSKREAAQVALKSRTLGDPGTFPSSLIGSGKGASYLAARVSRLERDFISKTESADTAIYGNGRLMRARGRDLGDNSPYGRKFLANLAQNVVGPDGVLMQAKIVNDQGKQTAQTKKLNNRIEQEWKRWCKKGRATADGKFSWLGLQILAIKNCGREGENLAKDVYGMEFNDSGYAVQVLDNDQLDDSMMQRLDNGNEIRMGVEVNKYGRPVAYHLFDGHPNDMLSGRRERKRIPAELITHTAVFDRPGQSRGVTWMAAAIAPMNQLNRYEEAVIVAARTSAAKFYAIEQQLAEGMYTGDEDDDAVDDKAAEQTYTAEAGDGWVLDPGQTVNYIDPRFPSPNHKQFMQAMLRSIATGLLQDYPTLANDLEGVNFSSIRAGMLDTRDCYRILQKWFIEYFCEPIFQKWLKMALLTSLKDITLTPAQMEMISWKPRGWDWVDPLKDAQAIILKLRAGLITYSDALATLGLDFEETMTERAMEQTFIEALGIHLDTDITGDLGSETDDESGDTNGVSSGTKKPESGTNAAKKRTLLQPIAIDAQERAKFIEDASELFRELRSLRAA